MTNQMQASQCALSENAMISSVRITKLYCEYLKVVWQIREICLTFLEFCQSSI